MRRRPVVIVSCVLALSAVGSIGWRAVDGRGPTTEDLLGVATPLEDPLERLEVDAVYRDVEFVDVVADLSRQVGLPIEAQWDALVAIGVSEATLIEVELPRLPIRSVVDRIAARFGVPLILVHEADRLVITTPERRLALATMRHYDVRRVVDVTVGRQIELDDAMPTEPNWFVDYWKPASAAAGGGGATTGGLFEEDDYAPDPESTLREVASVIVTAVEPDGWRQNGGLAQTLHTFNGVLTVVAAPDVQDRVARLIHTIHRAQLEGVDGGERLHGSPAERYARTIELLNRRITLVAHDRPARDVFRALRAESGLPIDLPIDEVGVDTHDPVPMTIEAIERPAAEVLARFLAIAVDRQPGDQRPPTDRVYAAVRSDGLIAFTMLGEPDADRVLRVYAVGDLARTGGWSRFADDRSTPVDTPANQLADILRDTICPEQWMVNGGVDATMVTLDAALIVRARPDIHDRIATHLAGLRSVYARAGR